MRIKLCALSNPMGAETTANANLASQILVLLGQNPAELPRDAPAALPAEALRRCTREQLLDAARRLGLTGVSKLPKEALAGRVQFAFEGLAGVPADRDGQIREQSDQRDSGQNGAESDAE